MPSVLKFRRGNTATSNSFTGAEGELFVDTTKDTLVVHDGSTTGGTPLATESFVTNQLSSKQNTLVSGTSIKTVGGVSLLGSGNISLFSGSYNDLSNKPSLATVATSGSYNDLSNKPSLATVATSGSYTDLTNKPSLFSGSYNDLSNKPSIPTTTSQLTNNSGFITNSSLSGLATESFVTSGLDAKQDTLVSGSNIKSINGQSVLGSGDLIITGDGSALDLSQFATKTDLLILDSDDIDEGLTNQYYTNQKVANVLLNGTHTNVSFAFNGATLSATVAGGDTYDTLNIQQSEVVIGTVSSKSIIPATTEFVEYVGTQTGDTAQEELYSVLKFNYGYFYSSYADIYTTGTVDKIEQFFAIGNTVRITKDQYWWDLQITGSNGSNSGYYNAQYTVTNTNSPWSEPNSYDSYYSWNQNIKFATDLPVAQKYVLTLNNPAIALGVSDKLLFDGSLNGTSYPLNLTDRGTWDIGFTSGGTDQVTFGSNTYYANQDPIKDLLQVGTTVTISDNTWLQSGVYLVTSVGADTTWNSPYGFSVQFQYVSGTNYNQQYTSLSQIFSNYFATISGTVVPNYTTKYRSSNFSTLNNTSYVSFSNYDFINVGDEVSYIPGIASIQFKNDAGNNVKAISYNNLTGAITYEGIVQSVEYNSTLSNLWSINSSASSKALNISQNQSNVVVLGADAQANQNSISIGNNANAQGGPSIAIGQGAIALGYQSIALGPAYSGGSYSTAIGQDAWAANYGTAIGKYARAETDFCTAIGTNSYANEFSQFSYAASNGSQSYRNQITIVQWGHIGFSQSGVSYIGKGQGNERWSSPYTWSNGAFELYALGARTTNTMALATATVMYKPTADQNNNDVKVEEIKFIVRTTSSNNWVIDTLSTTVLYSGSGSLHPNWSTTFEITNGSGASNNLFCKIDKGSDTTSIGVSVKVEFKVLSTQ